MRIFVTGASGFVGGAITKAFVGEGHTVVALVRSVQSAAAANEAGAVSVSGSLATVRADQVAGCDAVIHSAAVINTWAPAEDYWRTNVAGASRMLDAARSAGVRRFIHISTEAVLTRGRHMRDIDESYPYPRRTPFFYSRTKAEAERRVIAADDPEKGFRTISLRPRLVWGPGDRTLIVGIRRAVEAGRFLWIGKGKSLTSTCHVDNLVSSICLALDSENGGEVYFVADDEVTTFRVFLSRYLETQDIVLPERSLPGPIAVGIARLLDVVWRSLRLKNEPPLPLLGAYILARDCTVRCDKIKRDLGYAPIISIEDGLAAMPKG